MRMLALRNHLSILRTFGIGVVPALARHLTQMPNNHGQPAPGQRKGGTAFQGQHTPCHKQCSIRMEGADRPDQINHFTPYFMERTGPYGEGCLRGRYSKVDLANVLLVFAARRDTLDFSGVEVVDSDRE